MCRAAICRIPARSCLRYHRLVDTTLLVETFELEARLLDATLRRHPRLRPLFAQDFDHTDRVALKDACLRLLKLAADQARIMGPALRAAGETLRGGDEQARQWSRLLLGPDSAEADDDQVRAHLDMRALGAGPELLDAPPPAAAEIFARFFIGDVLRHPWAILGARGVLRHLALRVADDLAAGLRVSPIAGSQDAASLFSRHGVAHIDHVRERDRLMAQLDGNAEHLQVLEGAWFTSGIYRSLVRSLLPS
jgi:hypothetical protein